MSKLPEFSAKNAEVRLEEARAGNIIGKVAVDQDAQNRYYSFMTRDAKVKAAREAGVINSDEYTALNSLGDLQRWEMKVLARLYALGDNDPTLMQILAYTKCDNREDCATVVARKQYKKQLVENSISNLLSSDEVQRDVDAASRVGRSRAGIHAFGLQG
jgi:hypothetical protein